MGSSRTAEDVKPPRGIGDNGPPPEKFTLSAMHVRQRAVLRMDLTPGEKLVELVFLIEANRPSGIAELATRDIMTLAGIRDPETVYKVTKSLRAKGVLEKTSGNGQTGKYNPNWALQVEAEYIARKTPRVKPDRSEMKTTPIEPDRSEIKPDGLDPTGRVEPEWSDPFPSRARGLDNNLIKTNTSPEREEGEDRGSGGKEHPEKEIDEPTPLSALEAFQLYNEMAARVGLPQARTLTPQRRKSMMARMREHGGIEAWKTALANIERSKFLQGSNDRGWRADLDFLIQASRFTKVVEGTYGNGAHADQGGAEETKDERIARIVAEAEEMFKRKEGRL